MNRAFSYDMYKILDIIPNFKNRPIPIIHLFDLNRSHYDRFGHFIKGLFTIVIIEILIRKTR